MPDLSRTEDASRNGNPPDPVESASRFSSPVDGDPSRARRRSWQGRFGGWCARRRSAVFLTVLLATVSVIGSLFPQIPSGLQGSQRTMWLEAMQGRYGRATVALQAMGAFAFARSPLYLCATGLLVTASLICISRRWRRLWREYRDVSLNDRPRAGTLASSYQLSSTTAPEYARDELTRALVKAQYRVRTGEDRGKLLLRADRRPWARLGTLATHLAVPLAVYGMLVSSLWATRLQVALAPNQVAPMTAATDVLLRNDGFELVENAEGATTSFRAQIALIEDGTALGSHTLRVNRPLKVQGHQVFLDSYWETPEGYGVALVVARDPGYAPFVVGGLLFALGTVLALWFSPSTLWITLADKRVAVRIAGRESARRRAEAVISSAGLVPEPEESHLATLSGHG